MKAAAVFLYMVCCFSVGMRGVMYKQNNKHLGNKYIPFWEILFFLWVLGGKFYAQAPVETTVVTANIPPYTDKVIVDNFEDGEYLKTPAWWSFGQLALSVGYNTVSAGTPFVQKRSLVIRGEGSGYLGGLGVYRPTDLGAFSSLRLVLFAQGSRGAELQIQLFEDDNGNFVVDTPYDKPNVVSKDDKWVYSLAIDWEGWREVIIPFKAFHDANPTVGDNVWNPLQEKRSGGFLQLQLLVIAPRPSSGVMLKLDTIEFVKALPMTLEDDMPPGDLLEEPVFHENIDKSIVPLENF